MDDKDKKNSWYWRNHDRALAVVRKYKYSKRTPCKTCGVLCWGKSCRACKELPAHKTAKSLRRIKKQNKKNRKLQTTEKAKKRRECNKKWREQNPKKYKESIKKSRNKMDKKRFLDKLHSLNYDPRTTHALIVDGRVLDKRLKELKK